MLSPQLLHALSHLLHMLRINLLSSVKSTGGRRWTCQLWYSMALSTGKTKGCLVLRPPSWIMFLIVWSETFIPVACWRLFCSSGRAHAGPSGTKAQTPVTPMGWRPSTALSSSPRTTAVSPGISSMLLDCAGRHSKPSGNDKCWCSVLEDCVQPL